MYKLFILVSALYIGYSKSLSTSDLLSIDDYQNKAQEILSKPTYSNFWHGTFDELTLNYNNRAFHNIRIRPNYVGDVSKLNITTNILGTHVPWPVGIAPIPRQKSANAQGEIAAATAAARHGSIYLQCANSDILLEDLAKATKGSEKWFQVNINQNETINKAFISRIEKAGFKAIVIALNAGPLFQIYSRNRYFKGFKENNKPFFPNYEILGVNAAVYGEPNMNKDVIARFVQLTKLPVIAKGILTKEGALMVKQAGCKGIIVSNYGGIGLDSAPASIEALPEVVAAVGDSLIVMLDSGIRGGPDIFKALALGAKYVFTGTSPIWGLAVDGENGVYEVLNILRTEFTRVAGLAGCAKISDINRNSVVHKKYYEYLIARLDTGDVCTTTPQLTTTPSGPTPFTFSPLG